MKPWVIPAAMALVLIATACGGSDDPTAIPTIEPTATQDQQTGTSGNVAQNGDTVSVHYIGTLDDGEEFDTSRDGDPFVLTIGGGGVIDGFNDAVLGLAVGETITVRLEPSEAYGERDESLIVEVPLDQVPENIVVGDMLRSNTGSLMTVVEVTGEVVRLDANHPFAGKALNFEIELLAIE